MCLATMVISLFLSRWLGELTRMHSGANASTSVVRPQYRICSVLLTRYWELRIQETREDTVGWARVSANGRTGGRVKMRGSSN
jgi:hypothetical protein